MKEKDIRKQIQDYLRWTGWFVFYHLQGGVGVYRGLPDLQAVKDGKTVYIEVKRPGGRQSEHQKRFQRDIEKHGGQYILAFGVEDVEHLSGGQKQLRLKGMNNV